VSQGDVSNFPSSQMPTPVKTPTAATRLVEAAMYGAAAR
jgi:hypothetical protein